MTSGVWFLLLTGALSVAGGVAAYVDDQRKPHTPSQEHTTERWPLANGWTVLKVRAWDGTILSRTLLDADGNEVIAPVGSRPQWVETVWDSDGDGMHNVSRPRPYKVESRVPPARPPRDPFIREPGPDPWPDRHPHVYRRLPYWLRRKMIHHYFKEAR